MPIESYLNIKPFHINATKEDLDGNNGLGRYVFLTGCPERARHISERFDNTTMKSHPRGHNLYLGNIVCDSGKIDVASISTGIGAPSTDNIFHELCILGAKNFLRIGTSGTLQPHMVKVGDVVIASAAVRDESTSANYITRDFPAIASIELVSAAMTAANQIDLASLTHVGVVHSKDSLYAREMGCSYLKENSDYMAYIKKAGVLVSEMECSIIFTLSAIIGYYLSNEYINPGHKIMSGALLAVAGGDDKVFSDSNEVLHAVNRAIDLGFETFKVLHKNQRLTQGRKYSL